MARNIKNKQKRELTHPVPKETFARPGRESNSGPTALKAHAFMQATAVVHPHAVPTSYGLDLETGRLLIINPRWDNYYLFM